MGRGRSRFYFFFVFRGGCSFRLCNGFKMFYLGVVRRLDLGVFIF